MFKITYLIYGTSAVLSCREYERMQQTLESQKTVGQEATADEKEREARAAEALTLISELRVRKEAIERVLRY